MKQAVFQPSSKQAATKPRRNAPKAQSRTSSRKTLDTMETNVNRRPSFDHLIAILALALSVFSTTALVIEFWSAPAVVAAVVQA